MTNTNKLWRYLDEISGTNIQTFNDRKKTPKNRLFFTENGFEYGLQIWMVYSWPL